MSELSISAIAEINPSSRVPAGLQKNDLVSFIPMGDVSEDGQWPSRQTRSLGSLGSGFAVFTEGDVLVAKITPCMENGKGVHAVGLVNGVGFGSTEFHVLRAKPGVSPGFVFQLTKWKKFRQEAESAMVGSAGQKRVQRGFFDSFQVPRFDGEEQRRITKVLDTLDTAIHQTEALIAKLKAVKQGLLHDLLTRGIDASGELRPPQSEAPHLYKQSPVGWIPLEWSSPMVTEIAKVLSGATPARAQAGRYFAFGGIPWVKTLDLNEDEILVTEERITAAALRETSCALLPEGAVLVAMYGGWQQIGRAAMLGIAATTNQAISALMLKSDDAVPEFVLRALQHGRSRWQGVAASTRKDPNITKADVLAFRIPWPSFKEQVEIARRFKCLLVRLGSESVTLAKMRKEKFGLMDDLLSGRVRVTPLLDAAAA